MAIAIIQDWLEEETDRSTTNYDAVSAKPALQEPIDGLIVHTAGYSGKRFRIRRRAADVALSAQEGGNPTPPTMTVYALHNVMTP